MCFVLLCSNTNSMNKISQNPRRVMHIVVLGPGLEQLQCQPASYVVLTRQQQSADHKVCHKGVTMSR